MNTILRMTSRLYNLTFVQMIRTLLILSFTFILFSSSSCEQSDVLRIAFYNVENLFDTEDAPNKIDEYYTPSSPIKWNEAKYQTKLKNLSTVIEEICYNDYPHILGLCEVENLKVLEDLVEQEAISSHNYQIIHFESNDARGIDNALLYDEKAFKPFDSGIKPVDLSQFEETTRDILWVKGTIANGDTLICMVNHWPSRREGKANSEPKRVQAAKALKALFDNFEKQHPSAGIVAMGDFNDEPSDVSLISTLGAGAKKKEGQLHNLMSKFHKKKKGSYNFRGNWNMLDQIIVNDDLFDGKGSEVISKATGIKHEDWLIQKDEKYYGYP